MGKYFLSKLTWANVDLIMVFLPSSPTLIFLSEWYLWSLNDSNLAVGPCQNFLTWARSATSGFGKFLLKISSFFLQVKKHLIGSGQKIPRLKTGQPLIYCRSKVNLGWVGSGQGSILFYLFCSILLHSFLTLQTEN